jgi:hypothetical protein
MYSILEKLDRIDKHLSETTYRSNKLVPHSPPNLTTRTSHPLIHKTFPSFRDIADIYSLLLTNDKTKKIFGTKMLKKIETMPISFILQVHEVYRQVYHHLQLNEAVKENMKQLIEEHKNSPELQKLKISITKAIQEQKQRLTGLEEFIKFGTSTDRTPTDPDATRLEEIASRGSYRSSNDDDEFRSLERYGAEFCKLIIVLICGLLWMVLKGYDFESNTTAGDRFLYGEGVQRGHFTNNLYDRDGNYMILANFFERLGKDD